MFYFLSSVAAGSPTPDPDTPPSSGGMLYFLEFSLAVFILAATIAGLIYLAIHFEPAWAPFLSRHLGASWRTTFWGSLSKGFGTLAVSSSGLIAAYANPVQDSEWWFIIKLIPQRALFPLLGFAALISLVSGIMHGRAGKATEVQGGTVAQDSQGNVKSPG